MNRIRSWSSSVLGWCFLSWIGAAPAVADSFDAFRIPDHTWSSSSFTLDADARRNHMHDAILSIRNSNGDARFSGSGEWSRDGDQRQWSASAMLQAAGFRSDDRQHRVLPNGGIHYVDAMKSRRSATREGWGLGVAGRTYPRESAIGVQGGVSVLAHYEQRWYRFRHEGDYQGPGVDIRQFEGLGSHERIYSYRVTSRASLGHGKVRDATGVLDAQVLEQRLVEAGVLSGELTPETRGKLAALFYVSPRYSAAHDRLDRYFWRDIERVLAGDPALKPGGLDAWSLLRGREPYAVGRVGVIRRTGHFVGPVLEMHHVNHVRNGEYTQDNANYNADTLVSSFASRSSDRSVQGFDYGVAGIGAEWHRPLGWRWQFDASARALVPFINAERGLDFSFQAGAQYLIVDRWLVDAAFHSLRAYLTPDGGSIPPEDLWETRTAVSLAWYVEDRTSLFITLEENQGRVRSDGFLFAGNTFRRGGGMRIGVNYRATGRLAAPGLIETLSLAR